MRWTHGSRRAESVGKANPPNFPPGHRRKMGPRGIPAGLSGAFRRGCAIRLQGVLRAQSVGRGVSLPFFYFKKMEDTDMRFENVQGSIVAMITPFHEDGSVNSEVLEPLLEPQVAAGIARTLPPRPPGWRG